MDEEKDEVNKGESKGDELQVADDFKGKWISFRNKGKKKIKKLLKSRKHTKTVEGDSEEDDDEEYDDDDRLDSTFLDAGASTEDEHYSSGKESPKSTPGHGVTAKESTVLSHSRRSPSSSSLSKLWMVHVELISGHNLAIRDRSGTSDPYVKIYLGQQKHKSRIINRNLNPVWNESFSYTTNDLNELMLFKVKDHNWGSRDDFMGRATVKLTTLNQTDEEEIKLELKDDATSEELGYLLVKLRVESGTTHVADVKDQKSLKKQHKKPSPTTTAKCQHVLMITLLRGKSLLAMNDNSFSDPYCKFKLGAQKYKSKVMHKTLDPEWKERFELSMYEEESTSLTVEVRDRNIAAKDDFMGKCHVDLTELAEEMTHDLALDLDVGVGQIHMQLCITGTASDDPRPAMSPNSAASSSMDRIPSVTLQQSSISVPSSPDSAFLNAGASKEDKHYSSGRESPKDTPEVIVASSIPKESTGFLSHLRKSLSNYSLSKLWMVHVELISGHNLAIRDRSGTSDPYVKIRLGRQKHKSRIINHNLNPVWNESFSYTTNDLNELMVFKVYDHDWGSLDDFMGRATVKLTTLNQTDEKEMKLELKDDATSEELGYLLVKLRVESGTTHVEDQKSPKKQYKKQSSSTTSKCQLWNSIVMVTLLRGKSLQAMDDNGFSDPYCKFKLGAQKYKSKVMHKTLDPEWKERFELRMYEEESTSLTVEVWDRDIAAKDDFMGKCHVDLTELAEEMTHNLVLDLDVGVGQIHIQLCITGTASDEKLESQQSTKEIDWNEINAKYSLRNTIKSLKDVGFLQVILGSAEELVASGHCNPFAILEVGNSRVRTHTLYKTHNPSWDKTFNFNIKDVHDNLEVSIFSGDKNTELLGKVCIPLLNVTNGKRKAYALKKKDCIQRSHGSVLLTCRFVYNNVRAAIRTINPREMKVLEAEPKLNRKVLMKNIRRVSSQIEAVYAAIQFVNGLFQWTNYLHSFVAFVLFVVLSLYGDWWMPFMMLVLIFAYQYVAVGLFTQQTKGLLENSTGDSSDSESEFSESDDDELMGTKPNEERRSSIRQKLKQFQNVLIIVQTTLDQIANTVERVYNLFNWSVPYCSMFAVTVLCGGAILFYMVPVNYIVLAWGVNKFSKKLLKPNYIPNNELLDFLSRLPSDEELLMRKELRPHLLTKEKKSR